MYACASFVSTSCPFSCDMHTLDMSTYLQLYACTASAHYALDQSFTSALPLKGSHAFLLLQLSFAISCILLSLCSLRKTLWQQLYVTTDPSLNPKLLNPKPFNLCLHSPRLPCVLVHLVGLDSYIGSGPHPVILAHSGKRPLLKHSKP